MEGGRVVCLVRLGDRIIDIGPHDDIRHRGGRRQAAGNAQRDLVLSHRRRRLTVIVQLTRRRDGEIRHDDVGGMRLTVNRTLDLDRDRLIDRGVIDSVIDRNALGVLRRRRHHDNVGEGRGRHQRSNFESLKRWMARKTNSRRPIRAVDHAHRRGIPFPSQAGFLEARRGVADSGRKSKRRRFGVGYPNPGLQQEEVSSRSLSRDFMLN